MNKQIKSYLYKMSVNFSTFVTSKISLYCCCAEMKKSMKKDIILQIRYSKVKIKFRLKFFYPRLILNFPKCLLALIIIL